MSPVSSRDASAHAPTASTTSRATTPARPRRLPIALAALIGVMLLLACDASDTSAGNEAPASVATAEATQPVEASPEPSPREPSASETADSPDATTAVPQSTQAHTTQTETTQTEATQAAPVAPQTPSAEEAMAHLRHLAEEIGVRAAGTEGEREAAEYIADVLRSAGYQAELDEFEFEARVDESAVEVGSDTLRAFAFEGSPNAEARGVAVFAGLGRPEDLAGADLRGRVVIFDRGIVTFREKVTSALAGGAIGVVIVNDEDGPFRGSLGGIAPAVPVVAVSGERRADLHAALGERITVVADARVDRRTSQNVVASVDGAACQGYLGAHYDSVPQGAGANDNASGTAVILELARTNPRSGLCIVAFGAEEVGLFGSQNYVQEHLAGTARFMLNVDMAGRLDGPIIVGNNDLTARVLEAIEAAGVPPVLRAGSFPPFASSDHVSFSAVGVPAVTFNSGDDAEIHTPQDALDRIDPAAVAAFLASVDAALDALLP